MARPRDTSGGGGGGGAAGGVFSSVVLDTSQIAPALQQLNAATQASATALKQVETAAEAEARAVREAAAAAKVAEEAQRAYERSLGTSFIALEKMQVAGLRYQDTLEKSTNKAASFSRGMIDISRGVEDFATGGFLGILNNIPGAFQNMGAAVGISGTALAGWTAGVSLAATALYVLYKNWDTFASEAKAPWMQTAAQEMETLAGKTERTADEQKRLNDLKREFNQIEQQRANRPEAEQKEGQAAGKAIQEADYDVLLQDVREAMAPEGANRARAEVERRVAAERAENMRGRVPVGMRPERIEQIQGEVEEAVGRKMAEEAALLIKNAQFGVGLQGSDARERLKKMALANPQMGGLAEFRARIDPVGPPKPSAEELSAVKKMQEMEEAQKKAGIDAAAAIDAENLGHYTNWKKQTEADDKKWRAAEDEKFKDDAAEFKKKAMNKIEDRQPLTAHEMEAIGEEGQRKLREQVTRDADTRKQLDERESDLLYQYQQTVNPTRQGQSMGLDQYEASIKSQSGESLEAKRIHRSNELLEDILEVQNKRKGLLPKGR